MKGCSKFFLRMGQKSLSANDSQGGRAGCYTGDIYIFPSLFVYHTDGWEHNQ